MWVVIKFFQAHYKKKGNALALTDIAEPYNHLGEYKAAVARADELGLNPAYLAKRLYSLQLLSQRP